MGKKKPNNDAEKNLPLVDGTHFNALLGKNPLPVFVLDVESGVPDEYLFLAVNEAACVQYGYSEDEFREMTMLDLHPEEDTKEVLRDVTPSRDSKSGEYSSSRPGRHVKKDGSVIHVDITAHRINYEGHQARVAIARDVTDKVRTRIFLQESEERYRMLVERNHAGVTLVQGGKLIFVSERVAEILGYSVREMVGKSPLTFLHRDDVAIMEQNMRSRQMGKSAPDLYPIRAFHKGGTVRDLEIIGSLVTWNSKPASLGSVVDVTDQKLAQQALAESENRYRLLVERNVAGVYLIQDGIFMYVNEQLAAMFGYSPDEIIGNLGPEDVTYPYDWLLVKENLRRRINGEVDWLNYEFRCVRKDGTVFYVEVYGSAVDYDGKTAILGTLIDFTERKNAEEALRQAKTDLERKNAELEAFVYTAAHDLRTPLVSVRGFLDLLTKDVQGKVSEKADFHLGKVMKNAEHFDNLLGDLLQFSQVGREGGQREVINISDMVGDIVVEAARLRKTEASIRVSEYLPELYMQPTRAQQVFVNLVTNSVKFSREGVPMVIKIESGPPEAWMPAGHVLICFRDNGVGIPKEELDEIFGLFSRPVGNKEDGTGVGLAIVKRIVEEEGGEIHVESEFGTGTTFFFSLPVFQPHAP